jgi:hypothetical protein
VERIIDEIRISRDISDEFPLAFREFEFTRDAEEEKRCRYREMMQKIQIQRPTDKPTNLTKNRFENPAAKQLHSSIIDDEKEEQWKEERENF